MAAAGELDIHVLDEVVEVFTPAIHYGKAPVSRMRLRHSQEDVERRLSIAGITIADGREGVEVKTHLGFSVFLSRDDVVKLFKDWEAKG